MKALFILALLCLLFSCSTNSTLPQWIRDFEHDPLYYSALSVVNSRQEGYKELAREYAAREIAMQINTSIESEIRLSESESFGISNTEYLSLISSSTTAKLKDISPVRSYNDGKMYYVWYRISKSEYHQNRRQQRDLALAKADELLNKYDLAQSDPAYSIPLLISALDQIADFLDMELRYQDRDLGAAILSRMHSLPSLLSYKWEEEEIEVVAKAGKALSISGKVTVQQNPAARIPLRFYSETIALPESAFSDSKGLFSLNIGRIDSFESLQYIDLCFDREYYDSLFQNSAALKIWQNLHFGMQRLKLNVAKPKIYLDYAYISGYQSGHRDSVAGYLANLNLSLTSKVEEAQYLLQIRIFSKKGDYIPQLDYYSSYADIHLSLIEPETGVTVNYLERLALKSGGNSRENAERNTERDAVNEIGDSLLYKLLYNYLIK